MKTLFLTFAATCALAAPAFSQSFKVEPAEIPPLRAVSRRAGHWLPMAVRC